MKFLELNEKDKKIISILKENARTPLKDIADAIGVSIPAVSLRIKELTKRGIIKGYHASIDYEKLGEACQLVLKVRLSQNQNTKEIGELLSKYENICLVINITGDYDFLILARCQNDEEGTKFINKIRQIEGISRVTADYILKCYKQKI
ncbi:MAG: Lrp/AsnC family transcriptional regulator [Candidatus Odinarchaeia archaeon]